MNRQYKRGVDREQGLLLPSRVEDYVAKDNPVRAVYIFIDSLDLKVLGFCNTEGGISAGQPAYPPKALLKLYLYGFLQGIRSSRKLERECQRNMEVIWLVEGLQPSYKTIADFRKDNLKGIKAVNKDFVLLCKELGLFGGELVAIDGSFFRGNVGKKHIYTAERIKKWQEGVDKQIEAYLAELEQSDAEEVETEIKGSKIEEKLEKLRARQKRNQERLKQMQASGEKQLAEVDKDARILSKNGESVAGYNVQTVVDKKNKLIVTYEVTRDGNDTQQLAPMAQKAQQVLGVSQLEVVADAGYYNFDQIKKCKETNIIPYVPEPNRNALTESQGRFVRSDFKYQAETDSYICPAGQTLAHYSQSVQNGLLRWAYRSRRAVCNLCPLKPRCQSPKSRFRSIYRWEHEEIIEAYRLRMAKHGRLKMDLRSCLAEHPFGTIKRWCGWDHFLLRGLPKVSAEMALWMLGYNFKRVLKIFGLEEFEEYCLERARNRLQEGIFFVFYPFKRIFTLFLECVYPIFRPQPFLAYFPSGFLFFAPSPSDTLTVWQ